MEVNFRYRFEAAHRFTDASSKCSTPHGHTWWVTLTLEHSTADIDLKNNFATDFKDLKSGWKKFIDDEVDHYFFLNSEDSLANYLKKTEPDLNVKLTPGDPTTEVLAALFFRKAERLLGHLKHIQVSSILLEETPTNSIRIYKKDADQLVGRLEVKQKNIWWS
jgi:6-pyruvoyl tetrahydropterin synthase/QueD family protein